MNSRRLALWLAHPLRDASTRRPIPPKTKTRAFNRQLDPTTSPPRSLGVDRLGIHRRTYYRRQRGCHQSRICPCKALHAEARVAYLQDSYGRARRSLDDVVWKAGRLQCHDHRPPRTKPRGLIPYMQQTLHIKDRAFARRPDGE